MKVLILDDDDLVARSVGRVVAMLGFGFEVFDEPDAALERVRSDPDVGVVIADMYLGDADGVALLEDVAAIRPDVRRVLTSGRAACPAGWDEDLPGRAFLPKPFTFDALKAVLSG